MERGKGGERERDREKWKETGGSEQRSGNSAFFNLDTDTPRLMAVALGNLSTRPYFEDETGRICWENEPTSSRLVMGSSSTRACKSNPIDSFRRKY